MWDSWMPDVDVLYIQRRMLTAAGTDQVHIDLSMNYYDSDKSPGHLAI